VLLSLAPCLPIFPCFHLNLYNGEDQSVRWEFVLQDQ